MKRYELPEIDPATLAGMHADFERRQRIYIPPVMTTDGEVIDGNARVAYAREHGVKLPEPIVVGNLSRSERRELRIALNVHRRQLSPEQKRQIIADELRDDPARSDRMLADKVGMSHSTVAKIRGGQPGHLDEKRRGSDGKLYPARKPVLYSQTPQQTREAMKLLQQLGDDAPVGNLTPRGLRKAARQHERDALISSARASRPRDATILAADFRKVPPDWKADLIVTDPPWEAWRELGRPLGETIKRILKPGGLACVYTGIPNGHRWIAELESAGLTHRWQVVAINRSQGGGLLFDGSVRNLHTPIQVFSRDEGRFKTPHPLPDVILRGAVEKQYHEWQQPVSDAVLLIRQLSLPGSTICDLFSCSGTVAVATHRAGEGRKFIGCEIDPALVKLAKSRLSDEQRSARGA